HPRAGRSDSPPAARILDRTAGQRVGLPAPRSPMAATDADRNPRGDDDLQAESPDEAGVEVPPVPIEKVESERLLENEVRARLERDGFTDAQILRWVEAYFAEHAEGEPDDVVTWIRAQEGRSGNGRARPCRRPASPPAASSRRSVTSRRCGASRSRSRPAPSSGCSDRTAPARRPR